MTETIDPMPDQEQQGSPDTPQPAGDPDAPPPVEEPPGTTIPSSTYELVVVAAREARRLNDRLRRLADDKQEKVTSRAVERVLAGQVRFAYEDARGG